MKFLRCFGLLKECHKVIQLTVYKMRTPFYYFELFSRYFFKNIDQNVSKFKRVVFLLLCLILRIIALKNGLTKI